MRLKWVQIEKMSQDEILKELDWNIRHLDALFQLENKRVAFYNREVYETEMNVYSLKKRLKELGVSK